MNAMQKSDNSLHFPLPMDQIAHLAQQPRVPRYGLYGDPACNRDWFANVEPLEARASDRERTIAAHTHPRFTQIIIVVEGGGDMMLDGEDLAFSAPCALIIPPFRVHAFRYGSTAAGTVLTVGNDYLEDLLRRAPELKTVVGAGGVQAVADPAVEELRATLCLLADELASEARGHLLGAEIQLLRLFLLLLREQPRDVRAPSPGRSDLYERFTRLVEDRFRRQPPLEELAAELRVSVVQLRNACKAAAGLTPLEIMHDRIVSEAKRDLVHSGRSVGEIGFSLGFESAPYFSRFFSKRTGVSPIRYRTSFAR